MSGIQATGYFARRPAFARGKPRDFRTIMVWADSRCDQNRTCNGLNIFRNSPQTGLSGFCFKQQFLKRVYSNRNSLRSLGPAQGNGRKLIVPKKFQNPGGHRTARISHARAHRATSSRNTWNFHPLALESIAGNFNDHLIMFDDCSRSLKKIRVRLRHTDDFLLGSHFFIVAFSSALPAPS